MSIYARKNPHCVLFQFILWTLNITVRVFGAFPEGKHLSTSSFGEAAVGLSNEVSQEELLASE